MTFNDGGLHVIASKDGIRKKGFIPRRGDPFGEDDSHWAKRGERRGDPFGEDDSHWAKRGKRRGDS